MEFGRIATWCHDIGIDDVLLGQRMDVGSMEWATTFVFLREDRDVRGLLTRVVAGADIKVALPDSYYLRRSLSLGKPVRQQRTRTHGSAP